MSDNLQDMINDGSAWKLEGSIGRAAMEAIDSGACVLGHSGHHDYWGNYVPSRYEVQPGTPGSPEYAGYESTDRSDECTYIVDIYVNEDTVIRGEHIDSRQVFGVFASHHLGHRFQKAIITGIA